MNDLISVNAMTPDSVTAVALKILENMNSKTLLALGGMACLTTIVCVTCVSRSGGELTLSKHGLSIKNSISNVT